jgi:hypothetical protein
MQDMDWMEATDDTTKENSSPVASFFVLIPGCRPPQRADRSAAGTMPTRAFRYCEALRVASAFGWYFFPPTNFSLLWDGAEVMWTYDGADGWYPLTIAQFPGFSDQFDEQAPEESRAFAPPFLAKFVEPDIVQIWSGVIARTWPGWSLLVRPLANLPRRTGYELYEGIVETDRWFGPLFTNIRLTRTDVPVVFTTDFPLFQAQPIPQTVYGDSCVEQFEVVQGLGSLKAADWQAYYDTVVQPCADPERQRGRYGARSRRRQKNADEPT